jgi:hypothetical protein
VGELLAIYLNDLMLGAAGTALALVLKSQGEGGPQ